MVSAKMVLRRVCTGKVLPDLGSVFRNGVEKCFTQKDLIEVLIGTWTSLATASKKCWCFGKGYIYICICMHFTSHICCPWITWYRDADESFGFPKPGILGWQEPEKAHLSFTHLGRCSISCDLCQQMHASMPAFCQEKREKEKDAGTKSVLNCPSYDFCCLTWPWAVVQYFSPKV